MNEEREMDLPEVLEEDQHELSFDEGYQACLEDIVINLYSESFETIPSDEEFFRHVKELEEGSSFLEKALDFWFSKEAKAKRGKTNGYN